MLDQLAALSLLELPKEPPSAKQRVLELILDLLQYHLCPGSQRPPALHPGPRANIVLRPRVDAVLQQQLHNGAMATARRFMQGGITSECQRHTFCSKRHWKEQVFTFMG